MHLDRMYGTCTGIFLDRAHLSQAECPQLPLQQ